MRRQSGASSIVILAIILVAATAITIGVKIIPLYADNMKLNQAIASATSIDIKALSKSEIVERLQKSFRVNGISINPKEFKIIKTSSATTLSFTHEERVNIIANLDVVVTFDNYYSTADQ